MITLLLKIKTNYIAAIENCDPTVFESQGFIAGSVKSYARYLELDPDIIYELFCNESGFQTMHGMAKSTEQKEEKRYRQKTEDSLFISPTTAYLPKQKKWYEQCILKKAHIEAWYTGFSGELDLSCMKKDLTY